MKLQYKITIGVIIALIFVNSIYGVYQFFNVRAEENVRLNSKIEDVNTLIGSTSVGAIWNLDNDLLKKNLEAFIDDKEIVRIGIENNEKTLKLEVFGDSISKNEEIRVEEFPIMRATQKIADAQVVYTLKYLDEKVRDTIVSIIKLTFWLSVISTFVIFLISRFLLLPIGEIVFGLQKVDNGEYSYSMKLKTNDEFKEIEKFFNKMIGTIKKDIDLREKNKQQLEEKNQQLKNEIETRQKAENNLTKSEERYRLMADNATDIISQITPDGIYKYISNACEKLLGYTYAELIGRNSYFYVHKNDFEKVRIAHTNIIENSTDDTIAYRIRHKNGNYIWFETSYKLMRPNDDDDGLLITCVSREITLRKQYEGELKKAKQKAEESDLLKSAFLANMSHEIRTPMNGIVGFSDLLRKPTLSVEKRNMYVELINQSSTELLTIINDILDISKIEANQLNISKSEFDVGSLLNDLYSFFKNDLEQKKKEIDLRFVIDLPEDKNTIFTDANRLKQVLTNLVNNAVKFTKKGYIEMKCKFVEDKDIYLFVVKDTGIGIPSDQTDNVFERFLQVDNSSTREFGGTGLGLPICKGIVSLLGGEIWVVSDTGQGTEFSFTIPTQRTIPQLIEQKKEVVGLNEKIDLGGKTILVVEDDIASFFFLNEILSEANAEIIHAKDGKQAVDICHDNKKIDLVLMDMQLPIINGYDATAKIKQFRKNLPIIAQTANAMVNDKDKCLSVGCIDYIAKPIKEPILMQMIERYIL